MLDSLRYACSSSDSCSTTLRTARKSLKCSSRRGRVNQESGSWLRPPNLTLRASKLLMGIGNEEKRKKPIFIPPSLLLHPSPSHFPPSPSRPSRKVRITQAHRTNFRSKSQRNEASIPSARGERARKTLHVMRFSAISN